MRLVQKPGWAARRCYASANTGDLVVNPISGSIGAEIYGVNLANLNSTTADKIRQIWLKHKVVFFRDQKLDQKEFLACSALFGRPVQYPFVKGSEEFPEIIQVLKKEDEKNNFGGIWHSDTIYLKEPPMATMLRAEELPPYGGDTMFANQVAAYEALSDGLKGILSSLVCVNTSARADVTKTREDRIKGSDQKVEEYVSHHPAVRTHPETGEKSLFMNIAHTERFKGWTEKESAPLLNFLFQHQTQPEFTCRFKWGVDSLAMWDNRAALHNPINDYHGFRRSMYRITLAGDTPV